MFLPNYLINAKDNINSPGRRSTLPGDFREITEKIKEGRTKMRKNFLLTMFLFSLFALGFNTAAAQFTIKVPKMPKVPKIKIEKDQDAPAVSPPDTQIVNQTTTTTQNSPAPKADDDEMDFRLTFFLEEIAKAQKSIDEYDPKEKLYPVSAAQNEWLLRAISMREREKWGKNWLKKPNEKQKFADALDALAASAAQKLPTYKSNLSTFKFRNPAEEKMMKSVLTRLADYKIYLLGLAQNNWLISKNDYGLITARYKHGAVYLDDKTDDQPYCYLSYINIIQDYAGGGTYGASYAQFIRDEIVGCPAVK